NLDRGDARRIERKYALYTLAIGDLAEGEIGVDAGVLAGDTDPFKSLHPLTLAFDYSEADPHGVPRIKVRHRPVRSKLCDLLALDLLKKIHRSTFRSSAQTRCGAAQCRPHKAGRRCGVRRSASPGRHSRIRRWSPDAKTSGTARPCHSWGRVY